ncbi:hypothetical protein [Aridibaculum aurantiacum]|uniref:hypothetical protein n=1 Tax=Aridibaculum aurantiacum TaxID=2810307 RepID=UPI001A9654F9|nr:hypothetical protein [Aridibaculum aurantiacum]
MEEKQDPNLSSPQESNTTKHINFREAEENAAADGEKGNGDEAAPEVKKQWEDLRKGE